MRLKGLILFISTIISLAAAAQNSPEYLEIEWGDEEQISRNSTLNDIVGYDETGIYALKLQKRSSIFFKSTQFTLEHYNNKVKKTRTVLIDLNLGNGKILFEGIFQFGKRLYLFTSQNDHSQRKNKLYVQLIDKRSLKPSRKRAELADIGYKSRNNDGKFEIRLSRDSTKMMIWYDLPYKYGAPEKFGFQIYDLRFQRLWEKNIELPYSDQLFQLAEFKVDSKGNAYLLGKVFKKGLKERRKGKPNYKYHILAYLKEGKEIKEFIFGFENRFITDMQFEIDDKGDIIAAGFYSDKGSTSIKGSFYLKLDGQTKILKNKHFKDFDISELAEFLNERKAEKGRELYKYNLKDLILRDNGGAYLIAEQYYIKVSTYTDPSGFIRSDYRYYYNDIGVVNIDAAGKIKWIKRIPKKQVTSNDGGFYSSYAYSRYKNKLYLIFNDNPKNINNPDTQKIYNFQRGKNSAVVIVKIDDEGNISKNQLFNTRDTNVITRPKVSEQVSKNEMIIFGQWKKTNRLAKITFQ
jgi:hypothetical protein